MSGAKTYHRSYGNENSVGELPARVEAIPEGVVDFAGVRMLA
jgi:hypothetical protein